MSVIFYCLDSHFKVNHGCHFTADSCVFFSTFALVNVSYIEAMSPCISPKSYGISPI